MIGNTALDFNVQYDKLLNMINWYKLSNKNNLFKVC